MVTSLSFNISTKKYQGITSPSSTIFVKLTDPTGSLILNKVFAGDAFITASTTSALYSLPLDTSGDVVQGTYSYYYGTDNALEDTLSIVTTLPTVGQAGITYLVFDGMETSSIFRYDASYWDGERYVDYDPVYYAAVNYLGSTAPCLEFNVTNDCNFYPNGQITAVDSTNYGDYTIDSRSIQLYFPNGLAPAPVSPYIETTTAATLVVNTLATGMWTAILTVSLSITQDDGLTIVVVLTRTLNHNVACNSQLCSVNDALDQITSAYAADVACGSTTPRYAQELTLANAYYTQYQIERSCGDTLAAAAYADKITALLGQTHSSCGGSCGCSGSSCSCDSSCGCSGDDSTPQWVDNTSGGGYKSYLALLTQSGTAAPTAIELENTIGSILWARISSGLYTATLSGAFPSGKTFVRINPSQVGSAAIALRFGDNTITVTTASADGILSLNPFEIRVYN